MFFDTQMDYWSKKLVQMPHLHNLPIDKMRLANHTSCRQHLTQVIETKTLKQLNKLAAQYRTNLLVILQTIFSILICRYSNDTDIVMGVHHSEVGIKEQAFYSQDNFDLILRTILLDNYHFIELLEKNQATVQQAYNNQLPIAVIENKIGAQENLEKAIVQVKLHYQQLISNQVTLLDWHLEKIYDDNQHFQYDLELNITNANQDLLLSWFYNANIFEKESVERLASSFNELTNSIILSASTKIFSLPLIDQQESNRLLFELNGSDSINNNLPLKIHQVFEQQVSLTPDSIALKSLNSFMTYRELNIQANRIAIKLNETGIEPGTAVAVYIKDSHFLVVSMLGILKAGAIYMPLDTSFPLSKLKETLDKSGAPIILTDNAENIRFDNPNLKYISVSEKSTTASEKELKRQFDFQSNKTAKEENNAYIMFTSGSTEQPKGVVGTHLSVINRLSWMRKSFNVSPTDIFCLKSPISSVDHIAEVFQPLVCGASLVTFTSNIYNEIGKLAQYIMYQNITQLTLLPSQLKALIETATVSQLKSLNTIVSSGEPLQTYLVELLYKKLGSKITLLNLYGSTETGADASYFKVDLTNKLNTLSYFKQDSTGRHTYQEKDIFNQLNQSLSHSLGDHITYPDEPLENLKNRYSETQIPATPLSLEEYTDKLKNEVIPYLINLSSDKYIGHMTSPLPSFIPDLNKFISMVNQNIVKIETAKSPTFIERQVLAMMHKLFYEQPSKSYQDNIQDPECMYGVVTSGGSIANITALYCARNSSLISKGISSKELSESGAIKVMKKLGYKESALLVSQLAHYSIKKAASLLGIGLDNLIIIEQDTHQKVNTQSLEKTIIKCRKEKTHIIAIIGIAGATETGTIDPLNEMANIAEKHGIHFHVDAAWGGAFMFSEKYRHKLQGIERADSITICAHKQLYIAQGMSMCLFKDPSKIFSITTHAEYQSQKGSFDLGQFTLEGSRPALSLLLHASIHLFSSRGYAQLIDQSMEKAAFFSSVIENSDCFQLIGQNDLNIINYRYIPIHLREKSTSYDDTENQLIDKTTELIQKKQFYQGRSFVSKTRISCKPYSSKKITVFRVVLANPNTTFNNLLEVLQDQLQIASDFIEKEPAGKIMTATTIEDTVKNNHMVTVPIGKPIDNVKIYILDDYLNPAPIGVTGELYISGINLASGYHNHEDLNRSSFIENPYCKQQSLMFKTNDLARRLSCGNIEYLGRKDLQVKLKGHRVRLDEIKAQLDKSKLVKKSVVCVENVLFSENVLAAYIELAQSFTAAGKDIFSDQIKSELADFLPKFMIPSKIEIHEKLPLTPNGKIDFKSL